jgi:hypothetical protein
MSGETYVLSGGSAAFAAQLVSHLRAAAVYRLADQAGCVVAVAQGAASGSPSTAGALSQRLCAWVHILPEAGDDGVPAPDQTAGLLRAAALAERHLPRGSGATFVAVAPAWGVAAEPAADAVELAASAAGALAQIKIERWSQAGLRCNIVRYGGLDAPALPGMRPPGVLVARTPMHRLGAIAELADAIDFLASSAASYVTGSVLPVDGGWGAYSWFYPARDL